MTWSQLHQRMAFMSDLIEKAAEDPDAAWDFGRTRPEVEQLFGGEEGLLLSLEERWLTLLTAQLDRPEFDGIPAAQAYADLAARHCGLRGLLDVAARRAGRARSLQRDERWIVEVYGGVAGRNMPKPSRMPPEEVTYRDWSQQHQRMIVMAELIRRAAENPDAALDFGCSLPAVQRLFGGPEGLLLSLEQRWVTLLAAKLDQADFEEVPAEQARVDLAAHEQGLRALLDAAARRSERVRSVERDDEWIVEVYGGQAGAALAR
ncbi:hypothetical protein [Mycobacterium talmoniae]|nr:hypothetical protein [Mycobacterium talmoniae]